MSHRDESISLYEAHLLSSPGLPQELPNLAGKRLVCHCAASERCHCDVLSDRRNLWERFFCFKRFRKQRCFNVSGS